MICGCEGVVYKRCVGIYNAAACLLLGKQARWRLYRRSTSLAIAWHSARPDVRCRGQHPVVSRRAPQAQAHTVNCREHVRMRVSLGSGGSCKGRRWFGLASLVQVSDSVRGDQLTWQRKPCFCINANTAVMCSEICAVQYTSLAPDRVRVA